MTDYFGKLLIITNFCTDNYGLLQIITDFYRLHIITDHDILLHIIRDNYKLLQIIIDYQDDKLSW